MWVQGPFRKKLIGDVTAFKQDVRSFRIEWDAHGPMAPGLDPMEAERRLKKFQPAFEVRQCTPCIASGNLPVILQAKQWLPAKARGLWYE